MRSRVFRQVDVFTAEPYLGNPVAVVLDAEGLDAEAMARFARWTNLSETTFVTAPSDPRADYGLRIFTPARELPFAGHPTLGSAHAWLEAGGEPRDPDDVVQQCGIGLVRLRRGDGRLAFGAPTPLRSGPVAAETQAAITRALRVEPERVRDFQWTDNGPGWVSVLLDSADTVLGLRPDPSAFGELKLGAVGPYPDGAECAYEVRAFVPSLGVGEDPVTGSLNAGIAQWLIGSGVAPERYVARQGTVLRRAGRVHVERVGDDIWVGGSSVTCIAGTVEL